MIGKTEAIPIRIVPFGGTSHIVTWLTDRFGSVTTVIKGACRVKRIGGGQYDLGYRCELLFYERERNGMHVFKDCTALDARTGCRGDWQKTAAISYLCLLAGTGSVSRNRTPGAYEALQGTLQAVAAGQPLVPLLLKSELQALHLHGVAPQLEQCTICQSRADSPVHLLSARAGGLVCSNCARTRPLPGQTLSAAGLQWLLQLQRRKQPPHEAPRCPPLPDSSAVVPVLGPFLAFWLDLAPSSRAVAYQMVHLHLQNKPAA